MTLPLALKTKVYLGGPMTGLPDYNYAEFQRAAEVLRTQGYEVLNPADIDKVFDINPVTHPQTWQWYMRKAIAMLLEAEELVLLPGWQRSKGANLEHHLATQLQMPIRTIDVVIPEFTWVDPWKVAV